MQFLMHIKEVWGGNLKFNVFLYIIDLLFFIGIIYFFIFKYVIIFCDNEIFIFENWCPYFPYRNEYFISYLFCLLLEIVIINIE